MPSTAVISNQMKGELWSLPTGTHPCGNFVNYGNSRLEQTHVEISLGKMANKLVCNKLTTVSTTLQSTNKCSTPRLLENKAQHRTVAPYEVVTW